MELITDAQLAEQFGISVEKLHDLRHRHRWPCVKLGRFEVRFTEAQVEQIVAKHTETPATTSTATTASRPAVSGQTARSARRSRAG
jgi:hypothetical protein